MTTPSERCTHRDDARFGARVGQILDEDGELRERLADGPEAEAERGEDDDLMATLRRPAVRDREILDRLAE